MLIQRTFQSLSVNFTQNITEERKSKWLSTLHNDIIAPLYFGSVQNCRYNSAEEFVPDPTLLAQLSDKDFDTITRPTENLLECLLYVFNQSRQQYNIDIRKLQNFVKACSENYRDNPFHNFQHGFSTA